MSAEPSLEKSAYAGLSKHRIEALTDGIYAVAMTLLVIELKLPAHELVHSDQDLANALVNLIPKFTAWVISFLVLSLFWLGHQRMFQNLRHVDGKLVALNMMQLGFASLMPFSSALSGEFGARWISQIGYSINMSLLSISAILVARYIHKHPELSIHAMSEGAYQAASFRIGGLIFISIVAVIISYHIPAAGNGAFMLMMVIMPISRRIEAHYNTQSRQVKESNTLSV